MIVPDKVCFSCGELYDQKGHCWNEHYICSKCVKSNDCQCMDCIIDQPLVRNVIISNYASVNRWKGTQHLRSFVKSNESLNSVTRVLSLMHNLSVKNQKMGNIKLNNTPCSLFHLLSCRRANVNFSHAIPIRIAQPSKGNQLLYLRSRSRNRTLFTDIS